MSNDSSVAFGLPLASSFLSHRKLGSKPVAIERHRKGLRASHVRLPLRFELTQYKNENEFERGQVRTFYPDSITNSR